jgi:hypothetical protein
MDSKALFCEPQSLFCSPRTIRTLIPDQHPSGAGTIPSSKVRKFIDRTLALKGGNPGTRGWERKAGKDVIFDHYRLTLIFFFCSKHR